MKSLVTVSVFAILCCLWPQATYALNPTQYVFKKCPACEGRGVFAGWFGGWVRCEKCGGDGKVFNVLGTIFVVAFGILWVLRAVGSSNNDNAKKR